MGEPLLTGLGCGADGCGWRVATEEVASDAEQSGAREDQSSLGGQQVTGVWGQSSGSPGHVAGHPAGRTGQAGGHL